VPEAAGKPAELLSEEEKTIYYERMAFVYEVPGITSTVICITTDGFLDDLRVRSVQEIFNRGFQLLTRFDAERQLNQMKTLSEYSLTEHQFAQLVGKSRLYQYLPLKMKKSLDTTVPVSDTQISMVAKDYYQDKSFCKAESGEIDIWKCYNLFTSAVESSYIDTFLDRSVCSLLFINSLVQHLKGVTKSWFLT